jgi:AcrR family transcriptional regulator
MSTSTLERILIATEKEVALHGISGIKSQRIIKNAKVSNAGAINYYFKDQKDLILSALRYTQTLSNLFQRRFKQKVQQRREMNYMDYLAFITLPVCYVSKRSFPEPYVWGMQAQLWSSGLISYSYESISTDADRQSVVNMSERIYHKIAQRVGGSRAQEYTRIQIAMIMSVMADNETFVRSALLAGGDAESLGLEYDMMTLNAIEVIASGILKQPMQWPLNDYMDIISDIEEELHDMDFHSKASITK